MGSHHFGWLPMDPVTTAALNGSMTLPSTAAASNGTAYCVNLAAYASVPPEMMQPAPALEAKAARRRQEEEAAAIRLVHLLVTCAVAIQAGDYSAAHGNLSDARGILGTISTAWGIGCLAEHFSAALAHRLFPASPLSPLSPLPRASPAELHHRFYKAVPYLKLAHFAANKAILEAFAGCFGEVHVVDLAIMQCQQWPALMHALTMREGGPPHLLRISGIAPDTMVARDELREVGFRLTELARSLNIRFEFQEIHADDIRDGLLRIEGLNRQQGIAVNSVLQLHRFLADRDADPAMPATIDFVLRWVTTVRPRVFTVLEQEADHNRASLHERFTNALFHYAAVFDSMEAVGSGGSALAEAYIQSEIFDVVCGEGDGRAERHEPLHRWHHRLARAGLAQVPFGPGAAHHAARLTSPPFSAASAAGFGVVERDGSLGLAWHGRVLYSATAWRSPGAGGNGARGAAVGARDIGYMMRAQAQAAALRLSR
ncbi:hypothetical protein ACP4OV_004986 [Aristida adscensionis]